MTYDEIKAAADVLNNPVDRLEFVMELGRSLAPVPDGAQCTEILGCASRVEFCRKGNQFFARADSAMVRGLVAVLIAMVDGHSPDQIRHMDLERDFLALNLNLGAGRLNGVNSMIRFLQNL